MAAVEAHAADGPLPPPVLLPVLVIHNATEEDELLFQPESPPSSRTSSIGTPPTPEHSKFVWPSHKEDDVVEARETEPTTSDMTFDSFVETEPKKLKKIECNAPDSPTCEPSVCLDRSFSMVSTIVEDGDHDERIWMLAAPTRMSAFSMHTVKETTQQVISQPREAIARFQLKGGLVGWLHGDADVPTTQGDNTEASQSEQPAPSHAGDALLTPPKPRGNSLFGNFRDKIKQKHEQLEQKLQALEESTTGHHVRYSEPRLKLVLPRLLLQPHSRRSFGLNAEISVGFDDIVSSTSDPVTRGSRASLFRRNSRMRSASSTDSSSKPMNASGSVRSRFRSLSFATRTAKPQGAESTSSVLSSSALQWDAFPVEECLADPKLAAEFINTVLPGDEWLLTLLYSIEEYETLTTSSTGDATPSLVVQVAMATTIIDRFLTSPVCAAYGELEEMGREVRAVVNQYQLPSEVTTVAEPEGIAALISAHGATLPMSLFDAVYTSVFDNLRTAYDTKFRLTREYTQLLAHLKQQQLGDEKTLQHLVLTFDQVIESEWCCTVFWVYLFRTAHHHRLSFIMEVKFKLRRLHLATQQSALSPVEAEHANSRLQHEILLICRRFLDTKHAPLALPTTSPMLVRLRDDLLGDAEELEQSVEPDYHLMQRIIEKLDAMRTQTRVEFKRMSFERFASFLTSALYRDFIVHPGSAQSTQCTRADDLTQLLRNNRVSFHQTPVSPPTVRDLTELRPGQDGGSVFDKAVATVFAFRFDGNDGSEYTFRSLYVSALEEDGAMESLQKKVECFLVPEGLKSTGASTDAAKQLSVCFNFVAGTGGDTVYGAVWRFGRTNEEVEESKTKNATQGVCVLSRYPLVDALREYLRSLATTYRTESTSAHGLFDPSAEDPRTIAVLNTARDAFEPHCTQPIPTSSQTPANEVLDTTVQDLFDSLSITNAMRLFSLILQEKKIVLVSSSASVLVSVGETLRSLVKPLVWSHIYVPVLPMAMKAYLHCPTPFIFGLHSSYVRHCELPKPTDDLAIVNLDRDSVTGGGDVYLPPLRANALREKLTTLCKPRLCTRDSIDFDPSLRAAPFPSDAVRRTFQHELVSILRHLETFAFRFECADRTVAVVDTSNKSRQWPLDAARFYAAILQSQAFSSFLGSNPL